MYPKPYLTIPAQIELLKSRGMSVPDIPKASEYLQRIGYYRLSAYWHPMRKRDPDTGDVLDEFVEGTSFTEATDLYTFDGRLRLITLDALERLEVSLRTEVALQLGQHDPLAHRDLNRLDRGFAKPRWRGGAPKHREWLNQLDERAARSKDQFAEHFRTKYPNDDMPIWIAVELLDFGPLSHLLNGMKFADRQRIGSNYKGIHANLLGSWSHSLAYVRNICAHHGRLWNKPLVNQPALSNPPPPPELRHVPNASRYYAVAAIVRFMLKTANPRTSWRDRFVAHIDTFPNSPRFSIDAAGFPANWQNEPLWRSSSSPLD